MVRQFYLENEKGQRYNLMDREKFCFFNEPTGLGYSYSTNFLQLNNTFVENTRNIEKGLISGSLVTRYYDNLKEFIDFVEGSESLKFAYIIPFNKMQSITYFKDIKISTLEKTEIDKATGMLIVPVAFDCLSLWYKKSNVIYNTTNTGEEIRWDFSWDSKFADYNTRRLQYVNNGHVEAPIIVEIDGHILNPKIELYVEGELYQTVSFNVEIDEYEKLLYGTKENDFYITKQNTDGTLTTLFNLDVINFENDNVIRLPKNKSCELRISAENEVLNAQVTILEYYKAI